MSVDFAGIEIVASPLVPPGLVAPVEETFLVSPGTVYQLGGRLLMHPVDLLRVRHPRSPLWSTRSLGYCEAARDRRRYRA